MFVPGDGLISLSVTFSRFIHVVACVRIPFYFRDEQCSAVWLDATLFMHSSVDGPVGCLHLVVLCHTVLDTGAQTAFALEGFLPRGTPSHTDSTVGVLPRRPPWGPRRGAQLCPEVSEQKG